MDFINKTPTDKRFTGFGGLLLVTIRSVWCKHKTMQQ
jgi:hypothetical protein